MHLAILMTNTDESAFAQKHPKDGDKFTDLVHLARPDWTVSVYPVKDGVFPETLCGLDGLILTGSPASVHCGAPWVDRLLALIRAAYDANVPMFGACFGHQAIALALGGTVGRNPGGWVHGLTRNSVVTRKDWMRDLPDELKLYGSHVEQVTDLPEGAEVLTRALGCSVTGFAIGHKVYTTQHHPEMTPGFIAALTEEMADDLPAEALAAARASVAETADMDAFARSMAVFFEQARAEDRGRCPRVGQTSDAPPEY